jgi:predicted O-linked N-acetylglucosamine transferase (SPINDLY family)
LVEFLLKRWALSEAEAAARALVADDEKFSPGWGILGFVQTVSGQTENAKVALSHALAIDPHRHHHSQFLCALQYSSETDARQLRTAHEAWDAAWGSGATDYAASPPSPRAKSNKLKLGFVSSDFSRHPVGFLVLPALENLDRGHCSIACYSDRSVEDAYTDRFRAVSERWRNIYCQPIDAVERLIRDDEIDILFDLAGHWGERMALFARKPAPIQITWLGYVGTTGLQAMDYLLADRFHVPLGEEDAYIETILRMPHDYIAYEPPSDAPAVSPPPATTGQPFTFGSFNHPAKLTPPILTAWAEILRRAPRSRLLLKYGGLDDPGFERRVLAVLAQQGIEPDRVQLEGWSDNLTVAYSRIDLALDTQPYSGGLTTCEALWMGVPVVTWPGKTFAGRHATSHLNHAGVPQFIAASREAYIDMAVDWTHRLDELTTLRVTLRDQVRSSPLCNAKAFAHDLLELLQAIHNEPRD